MAREPTTTIANSEVTEAIDIAGPALFGGDWIDRLAKEELEFLAKHDRRRLLIGEYPPAIADRLCRLMGRDVRMGVQRTTVLRWLFANEIVKAPDLKCDRAALNAAIGAELARRKSRKQDGAPGNEPGRPPDVSERLVFSMVKELKDGKIDVDTLSRATGEFLKARYGASINTCFEARKTALAEWDRQRGEAFSKIPNK